MDPLTKEYPWYTPYQFAGNKPINSIDLDGLEEFKVIGRYHFGETEITMSTPRTVQEEISYIYNFNAGRTEGFISGLNPINQLASFADFIQSQSTRNHYYLITDNNGTQYLVHPSELQMEMSVEQEAYNEGYAQGFSEGALTFDVATGFLGELKVGANLFKVFKLGKNIDDLPTLTFTRSETPNVANNIDAALKEGKPNVLTREGSLSQQRRNRSAALKGKRDLAIPGQTSLDEFPFASTKEGGAGARVEAVPIKEQNIQGGKMRQFFKKNNVKDGDKFKVKVKDQ